jgi:hypothetical protein
MSRRHLIVPGVKQASSGALDGLLAGACALDADEAPLRLPLGDDAVDAILGHLDSARAEITTWEKLARNTRLTS